MKVSLELKAFIHRKETRMKRLLSIMLSIFLAVFVVIGITNNALAHERRDVGKYQVVVGFIVEPAIEGQKNGGILPSNQLRNRAACGRSRKDLAGRDHSCAHRGLGGI